ncbi:hypothetical protein [Pedobacter frigoris]|uniref:Uncharacterized protein n=1 Tax=Pedobacter frigoris TaxID=2571272 RepID=A0A4U1CSJ3_9SPHI|nr:hypothetical protein [Pedobacter frigoris]TKC08708.1 hypothetical protein FA047_01000 [Pedobacter frigoris]
MKKILYALTLSVILFSCQQKEITKNYIPRVLTANEKFNEPQNITDSAFKVIRVVDEKREGTPADPKEWLTIKRGDTAIRIQANPNDTASANGNFAVATYVNTQKTTILAQVKDKSGLTAPFFLVTLKDGKTEVIQLYRPSKGAPNEKLMGLYRVGRDGFLINQDFFVTNVNAKVYLMKRQNPEERINGQFFVMSPDKETLVFLMASGQLYQVHFSSGETHTEPLGTSPSIEGIYNYVQTNFSWTKTKRGVSFLKRSNDDRIVDISEFK